eukprot:2316617-Amphidinium_carterae.1
MVSFAFDDYIYFLLFTATGLLILGMTQVLWLYHRLLCRLTFRPKLFNFKYLRHILPPVVKGASSATHGAGTSHADSSSREVGDGTVQTKMITLQF